MKKFLALLLVMVMCVGAGIGGTLAYLTDRETEVNVFTVGNVDIELHADFKQGAKLLPGLTHETNVVIENIGTNDAWVFYDYAIPTEYATIANAQFAETQNWLTETVLETNMVLNDVPYTVYGVLYKTALKPGEKTEVSKSTVGINAKVDIEDGNWVTVENGVVSNPIASATGAAPVVYLNARAIQVEEFATVEAAKAAYYEQWGGLKVDNAATPILVATAEELTAALAAGGNVTLVNDIETSESIVIPAGKTVALDLNDKEITGTVGRDADNNRIHTLVNNGTLTIKNGTVKSAGNDGGSAICNNAGATLTIEDVTLYGAPQSDPVYEAGVSKPFPSYAVNNYGNAVVNGATVKSYHGAIATGGNGVTVINDADIDVGLGKSTGITSYVIYSYENAQVTVNGGKFAFTKNEIYVNGGNTFCELGTNPIMINGGNYIGTSFSTGAGREYVIKGGTFDTNPSAYVASGYELTDNGNGTWTVSATKVGTGAELSSAINYGKAVVLTDDVTYGTAISSNADINLNGNTFEATTTLELKNNSDLTMKGGNYEVNGTFGHVDVRPSTAEGSVVVFEDVDFSFNKLEKTFGTCTNRLGSVVEVCATVTDAHTEIVFRNCTFDNAKVLFEGLSGITGTFEATFEDCTFNALTSSAPIEVANFVKGTITVKNCTFNLECTSSSASAIAVTNNPNTYVTVNAENNTINAVAATPYTYDASKGETEVHNVKVIGTPANIKLISISGTTSAATETGTIATGIAVN